MDVTIFDQSDPKADITITAEEGYMTYSVQRKSLIFTLFHGEFHKMDRQKTTEYERSMFEKQVVYIPAEEFVFEERKDTDRSDREMTIAMMKRKVDYFKNQIKIRLNRFREITNQNMKNVEDLIVHSDSVKAGNADSILARLSENNWKAAINKSRRVTDRYYHQAKTNTQFIDMQHRAINKYLVEIYKKFSIPFASIVFVLIGAPLGIRARKGSMGVGISLSIGFSFCTGYF